MAGHDVLLIMPTGKEFWVISCLLRFAPLTNRILLNTIRLTDSNAGGGKSLTYQLPAIMSEGFTLVVSPLVSLMQDQIWALQQLKGVSAAMLDSSSTKEHVAVIYKGRAGPLLGICLSVVDSPLV